MTLFSGFRARHALLALTALSVVALLAMTAPAQGSTRGKALNNTKKVASQVCNSTAGCTRFGWSCGRTRFKNTQVPCKAFVYDDVNSFACEQGITWGVYRNKLYLLKRGRIHCYSI